MFSVFNSYCLYNYKPKYLVTLLSIIFLLLFSSMSVLAVDSSLEDYAVEVESSEITSDLDFVDESTLTADSSENSEGTSAGTDTSDYSGQLLELSSQIADMQSTLSMMCEYLTYIAGFGLFAIIVLLCVFCYKFFRMFF